MLLPFIAAALVILADQVSKALLAPYLPTLANGTLPLIPDVLHFTYVENRGAAFGMLADHRWVFMALSVVGLAAIVLIILLEKPKSAWVRAAAGLVLGGGIGNMIDRFRLGYVVDFIDCRFIDFYVFNIADSCVCVGCAICFVAVLVSEIRAEKAKKAAAAEGSSSEAEPAAPERETAASEQEDASDGTPSADTQAPAGEDAGGCAEDSDA
jgi:signal peptidase II